LLSKCQYLARRDNPGLIDADIGPLCPALWGKDEHGQPRTGHEHAFFLPADEDHDGRVDHLTVFAPMGFSALEVQACGRLRWLAFGDGDRWAGKMEERPSGDWRVIGPEGTGTLDVR